MDYTHTQINAGHTPRKLRYVADMIRKMTPLGAIETLQFTNRAASIDLLKAIKTSIANAGGKENLIFRKIEINEGMSLKRYRVGTAGRGRGRPYKKKLSHIKIVLTDEPAAIQETKGKGQVRAVKESEVKKEEAK